MDIERLWYQRPRAWALILAAVTIAWAGGRWLESKAALRPVSAAEARDLVVKAARPLVVEFVTPGCEFCRGASRILGRVAAEARPSIDFVQVQIEDDPNFSATLDVTAVPTALVFQN